MVLSSPRQKGCWKEEGGSGDSGDNLFSEVYFCNIRCATGVAHLVVKIFGRNFIFKSVPMAPRARNGTSGIASQHRQVGGREPTAHHKNLSQKCNKQCDCH